MEFAVLLILIMGAAIFLPSRWRVAVLILSAIALLGIYQSRFPSTETRLAKFRPAPLTESADAKYAHSATCKGCHPDAYASWHRSYHRTMTQPANDESVVGPFDGRILEANGRRYRVFRHEDGFFVDMPRFGTMGQATEERMVRPVVMTTGSHHMQAYWFPMPNFEAPTGESEKAAFGRLCGHCHGPVGRGGTAPSILDQGLRPDEIAQALRSSAHQGLSRTDPQFAVARRTAESFQFSGRLAQFPFVYLIKASRWAHEDHTFLQPPEPPEAGEPHGDRWSNGCDQCHAVKASLTFAPGNDIGEAEVAELGIACEACHGPARKHVERHSQPWTRYLGRMDDDTADDIIQPTDLDHRRASEICAQCHAELTVKRGAPDFEPGGALSEFAHVIQYLPDAPPKWLADHLIDEPDLLRDAFWRDGTIRVAGRDHNGLAISPCYTKGEMSCLTCHTMHGADPNDQLKPRAKGDEICADCHDAAVYASRAHTHHPETSEGSRCYNCHMPHTTTGLLGLIRAHRIDSPSAQTTLSTGRPNACNLCHIDSSLQEMGDALTQWYGQPKVTVPADELNLSAAVIGMMSGDAVQRAAYAWHAGWAPAQRASGDDWQAPFLAELLDDPYSAVRFIAFKSLRTLPGFAELDYDYTGSQTHRRNAVENAHQIWRTNRSARTDQALLLSNGSLGLDILKRLKSQRDDQPVRVNE